MSAISRRKFGNGFCNGCNGCQEEGSSATDSVTDVTDVTDVRKKAEEERRKNEELISCTIVNKALRGGRDNQPRRILNYCETDPKGLLSENSARCQKKEEVLSRQI
ncbi:hypothetical protein QUA54_15570 [Microcoleus sp. MOSTC5]|uniref:hypothetical protein n=1 Tax=Microcoleus sp. MOSTC5 TaxID=3055378 RepID=UPI002FCEEAF3